MFDWACLWNIWAVWFKAKVVLKTNDAIINVIAWVNVERYARRPTRINMNAFQNIDINDEMRLQANVDIANRCITGCYIYLLIWFAIIIPSKLYVTSPEICLCATLFFVTLSALRVLLIVQLKKSDFKTPPPGNSSFTHLSGCPRWVGGCSAQCHLYIRSLNLFHW